MSVEALLQEARSLTPAEQLTLAALIIQQAQNALPSLEARFEALGRVRGILKGLPGLEAFQEEKRRELELEERRGAAE